MADTSLDDFIKQKRVSSRTIRGSRRGGGGPRGGRGGRGRRPYSSARFSSSTTRRGAGAGFKASTRTPRRSGSFSGRGGATPQSPNNIQLGGPMGTSLIVSNLEFGVNDADIHELFSEFGRLRRYGVHYNAQGNSIGTAEVVFTRSSDAMKAIQAYQDVPLDGRPMRLHVAMSSFRITQMPGMDSPASNIRGAGIGRRGARRGRGGRGSRGGGRKMPSAVELNDELDVYHNKSNKSVIMDQN
ncbi:THO complex subunit 4-like [Oopsacas minuta]|uniref:THO complex subunit 4-like n=1 Tax=Oopsacas minuta TaxID=111878 RepID=A0AAV7KA16_9METZ|nr:THO complex subunit 4-like [Oopsacas minuta]